MEHAASRAKVGLLLALFALAGCGGGDEPDTAGGDLVWTGTPEVIDSSELPGAKIMTGTVRNDSLRKLSLKSKDLELLDASGKKVRASFGFVGAYVRPDQPRNRPEEGPLPEVERQRLGQIVSIEAGSTTPLTVSWEDGEPVRLDYGAGSLKVPD